MPSKTRPEGDDRLRPAPAERFEGPSHYFDLDAVAAGLLDEGVPARDGHRQMTIFRGDHITQVVFAFERGGRLDEHSAPGLVTIHVHRGKLAVRAAGEDHALSRGNLLVLDAGVPHDVMALEESVMLLTVHVVRAPR